MDEYGCLSACPEDAELVRNAIYQDGKSVVFPLSSGDGGCMIVHIDPYFHKIGLMPFGGNTDGRAYVSIWGRGVGCHHFAMAETHWSYFAEKLKLPEGEALELAKFWDLLWAPS